MTKQASDSLTPKAERPEWDGPISRGEFQATVKRLEEAIAFLEDRFGTQLDEIGFEAAASRVDSNRTQRQIGVDEAWVPFSRQGR